MRRLFFAALTGLLALSACERAATPSPAPAADQPTPAPPPPESPASPEPPAAPSGPPTREGVIATLAAHPAGLDRNTPDGRSVMRPFRAFNCMDDIDMRAMPFDRMCAWWIDRSAPGGADITVFLNDEEVIMGAALKNQPGGIPGWDCQPATRIENSTVCMATSVASAQSVAANEFWNSLADVTQ